MKKLSVLFLFLQSLLCFAGVDSTWITIMFDRPRSQMVLIDIEDAYGVAFRDLNNDERPDLYVVGFRSLNRVLIYQGRWILFEDETIRTGLGGDLMPRRNENLELGTCVFDFDNDRDNDVIIAGWWVTTLFENRGDLTFTHFPIDSSIGDMDVNGAFAADVNLDGRLDLYLTDEHYTNRLFINTEKGFIDETAARGLLSTGNSQGAAFSDVDLDGDMDLYVANWNGVDLFYQNRGLGVFVAVRLDMAALHQPFSTNSPSFADFDNDGDFDLFITRKDGPDFLYRNDTPPGDTLWQFTDISRAAGLTASYTSYSGVWADFDQDGWLDLFVTHLGPNCLYLNQGDETFIPVSYEDESNRSYSTGAAVADYDSDGDPDLFVANKDTICQIFTNPVLDNYFIKLNIKGELSNYDAIGARVSFYESGFLGDSTKFLGTREVGSGNGYLSMNDCVVHFGSGDHDRVDVEILFPSGRKIRRTQLECGNEYLIYEVSKPYRRSLILWKTLRKMWQHPQFVLRLVNVLVFFILMIGFMQIGLIRYAWKPMIAFGYAMAILLIAALLAVMLSPLGATVLFLWINGWTLLFMIILTLYSERILKFRRSRQQAYRVLIDLSQEMIHIHQDDALIKTIADHLMVSLGYQQCMIWVLNPSSLQITETVSAGTNPASESNITSTPSFQFQKLLERSDLIIEEASGISGWPGQWPGELLVLIRRDKLLYGLIALGNRRLKRSVTQEEKEILGSLSAQMAVTLENNAYIRQSNAMIKRLTEAETREKYLQELEDANQSLDAKNQELQQLYDDLKQTEVQLIHSEKMASLGQLVAGISHELNNPIGFIYANTRQLQQYLIKIAQKSENKDPEIQDLLTDIKVVIQETLNGSQSVKTLIDNLRQFSRLDHAEWKWADLHEGLNSALTILKHQWKDRIQIHQSYDLKKEVYCAPGQLNQVFLNLLSNAVQAIEDQGEIWIDTRETDGTAVISVRDSGTGISQKEMNKIFDPFFTTKEVGEGLGLGLSICYSIIDNHGGRILCDSETGLGTTFTVEIPVGKG